MGLDVEAKEEVEELEVSAGEEEWPSLGLDVEAKEEVEELEVSAGEEEWPSINSIPGLSLSQPQSISKSSKPKSSSSPVIEDASESSSLGELRFQDE